jgi:hypothetical protein
LRFWHTDRKKKGEENPHPSIVYAPNYLLTSCSSAELVTLSFGKTNFNSFFDQKSTIFDHITYYCRAFILDIIFSF